MPLFWRSIKWTIGWAICCGGSFATGKSIISTARVRNSGGDLELLEALAASFQEREVAASPFARLRAIATDRNKLAHGHFDQNPFDGSSQLVLRQQEHEFPADKIAGLIQELDGIAEKFRFAFYSCEFSDLEDRS